MDEPQTNNQLNQEINQQPAQKVNQQSNAQLEQPNQQLKQQNNFLLTIEAIEKGSIEKRQRIQTLKKEKLEQIE
ncbi:hypothetical protein J4206_02865, partial [Candidatus Woesearchaeota archaeon]|nr:hypothetical protein [Candidatus Woesearchaeota archaeon]